MKALILFIISVLSGYVVSTTALPKTIVCDLTPKKTEYQIAKELINTQHHFKQLPHCKQLYYSLVYYSHKYNIPQGYAFTIAQLETGYKGPFHWEYNYKQTSSSGALGAMQLLPKTAQWISKQPLTKQDIRDDVRLNVELSMKFLRSSMIRFKDWKKAFAYYHTGYTKVNWYAERVYAKDFKFVEERE